MKGGLETNFEYKEADKTISHHNSLPPKKSSHLQITEAFWIWIIY